MSWTVTAGHPQGPLLPTLDMSWDPSAWHRYLSLLPDEGCVDGWVGGWMNTGWRYMNGRLLVGWMEIG